MKDQTFKREAEEVKGKMNVQIEFNAGDIRTENEFYVDWKVAWRKRKNIIREGQIKNKFEVSRKKDCRVRMAEMQHRPEKNNINIYIAGTDDSNESMEEKGLVDQDKCRLCGEFRETVQRLLTGCKKLAGSEYVRRHDNALKALAVQWAIDNGMLPSGTK